jgi:hypothetical protein
MQSPAAARGSRVHVRVRSIGCRRRGRPAVVHMCMCGRRRSARHTRFRGGVNGGCFSFGIALNAAREAGAGDTGSAASGVWTCMQVDFGGREEPIAHSIIKAKRAVWANPKGNRDRVAPGRFASSSSGRTRTYASASCMQRLAADSPRHSIIHLADGPPTRVDRKGATIPARPPRAYMYGELNCWPPPSSRLGPVVLLLAQQRERRRRSRSMHVWCGVLCGRAAGPAPRSWRGVALGRG